MVLNTACVPYSFPLYITVHIKVNYNHNVSTLNIGKKNKCEFWRSFNTAVIKQTNKHQTLEELWNQLKSSLSHSKAISPKGLRKLKPTEVHACFLKRVGLLRARQLDGSSTPPSGWGPKEAWALPKLEYIHIQFEYRKSQLAGKGRQQLDNPISNTTCVTP